MNDTPVEIQKRYREMIMARTPVERLQMASRMFDSARTLIMSGILMKEPHLDVAQRRVQLFLRMYEKDFTATERDRIIKGLIRSQHNRRDIVTISGN